MIEELLKYQEADAKLRDIELKLLGSEDRKKAVMAKKYLDTVEDNTNKLDARAAKLAEEYEKLCTEQVKLAEQGEEFSQAVDGAEDATETSYLLKKAEELTTKLKNVSATINKVAEEIQSVIKEYMTIKNNKKAAQLQYAENGKKYNEYKATFQAEREEIEKNLEQLKKDVDPALMERYKKKRDAKIYPIVYEVHSSVCGACNMELSMSDMTKLKNGEITECDHCGRLLYMKQ